MSMGAVAAVVGAGTSIYGAVSGGRAAKKAQKRAEAAARMEFQRKYNEWESYWNERIPRLTLAQQKTFEQTKNLFAKYKPLFEAHFEEQDQEKVYRNFIEDLDSLTDTRFQNLRTQIDRLSKGEKDEIFAGRVAEAEQEINRASQETIDMMLRANRRNINRGGLTQFNPEREDEMMSIAMQRARDEARSKARTQVEDTLFKLLGQDVDVTNKELTQKLLLLPGYADLAEDERARLEAALKTQFEFDAQEIQLEDSMATLIDKLNEQRYRDKPDYGEISRAWLTGQQPGQSTAQTVRDVGYGTSDLLRGFGDLWNRYQGSNVAGTAGDRSIFGKYPNYPGSTR